MPETIILNTTSGHTQAVDPGVIAYNIEMAELTGGTFWKPFTDAQIAGTEAFPSITDYSQMASIQEPLSPIDLRDPALRRAARQLGPCWVRVSGTWANKTWYAFREGEASAPAGYDHVLTLPQWTALLDFVRETGGRLLVSAANCAGSRTPDGEYDLSQFFLLLETSKNYGVPVSAVTFTNEPNMLEMSGLPAGYTAADYARDQDRLYSAIRARYPEILLVGPDACNDELDEQLPGMPFLASSELLRDSHVKPDVFAYHYYNGVSERVAAMGGHWDASQALSPDYLAVSSHTRHAYQSLRDRYAPGAPLWVTESGDAACGGNTWASTFLDVFRTANELGEFTRDETGIIFHNTLASSDYGLLQPGTFSPRPNYWFLWLWKKLIGTRALPAAPTGSSSLRLFAFSGRNNGETVYLALNLGCQPVQAESALPVRQYSLTASCLRSTDILLNGRKMEPSLWETGIPEPLCPGTAATLEPHSISFLCVPAE